MAGASLIDDVEALGVRAGARRGARRGRRRPSGSQNRISDDLALGQLRLRPPAPCWRRSTREATLGAARRLRVAAGRGRRSGRLTGAVACAGAVVARRRGGGRGQRTPERIFPAAAWRSFRRWRRRRGLCRSPASGRPRRGRWGRRSSRCGLAATLEGAAFAAAAGVAVLATGAGAWLGDEFGAWPWKQQHPDGREHERHAEADLVRTGELRHRTPHSASRREEVEWRHTAWTVRTDTFMAAMSDSTRTQPHRA